MKNKTEERKTLKKKDEKNEQIDWKEARRYKGANNQKRMMRLEKNKKIWKEIKNDEPKE